MRRSPGAGDAELSMLQQFLDDLPTTGAVDADVIGATGVPRVMADVTGTVLSGSLIECPTIDQWPGEADTRHAESAPKDADKDTGGKQPIARRSLMPQLPTDASSKHADLTSTADAKKPVDAKQTARKRKKGRNLADMPQAERQKLMRERNRRHAADCRMRKRIALEESRARCATLEEENATIKEALKEACDALEILKQNVTDRFGVTGQKLLHAHAIHMKQRDALLCHLDTVLAGPNAHDAMAAATSMRIQAVPAPRAKYESVDIAQEVAASADALCFGAPNSPGT